MDCLPHASPTQLHLPPGHQPGGIMTLQSPGLDHREVSLSQRSPVPQYVLSHCSVPLLSLLLCVSDEPCLNVFTVAAIYLGLHH